MSRMAHQLLLGSLVAMSALLSYGCQGDVRPLAAGDEPPIRVKNGSLDLEIIGSGHKWKNKTNRYEFNGGTREFDYYVVDVRPKDAMLCKGPTRAKGSTVVLTFTDDQASGSEPKTITVTLTVVNKKTHVTWDPSSYVPALRDGDKVLRFGQEGKGYVAGLTVEQTRCDFTDASGLEDALVNDFKQ